MHVARTRNVAAPALACLGLLLALLLPFGAGRGARAIAATNDYRIDPVQVAAGFNEPTAVVDPGDGSGRLFVVERSGVIWIVRDGAPLPEPFLDLTERVAWQASPEQGLFSLAFDPDFARNGLFYVTYAPIEGDWRLERFKASDAGDVADSASATTLLTIPHPGAFHYGGQLLFGPDGYLWVSVGDGGWEGNPWGDAQNLDSLLGKLLRIDVAGDSGSGSAYTIPPDNPFVGVAGARPEIWADGLRNPWRMSFDRASGNLYIGDVGLLNWEEIDVQPAGASGGANYGWPSMEGMQCSSHAPDCDPRRYTPPVAQYSHAEGCAVIGGYVARADPTSPLYGAYVFSDNCSGTFWTLQRDASGWSVTERQRTPFSVSAFGEDAAGALYAVDLEGGGLYRLEAATGPPRPGIQQSEPATLQAGGVSCGLTLRGWNFERDASVTVDGAAVPTYWIDSTTLTFTLPTAALATPGERQLVVTNSAGSVSAPASLTIAGTAEAGRPLFDRWTRIDGPVASGAAQRTWLWGPRGLTCPSLETYADAPGGARLVQYFDKSRMEINDPSAPDDGVWHVTNGLLVTELITGRRQLGDDQFEQRAPADSNVAGDPDDTRGPTYAALGLLLPAPPVADGALLTARVDRQGTVSDDPALGRYGATAAQRVTVAGLDHRVASVFWDFMNSSGVIQVNGEFTSGPLFVNPFYATGYPLTEPYWTTVAVGGVQRDVLLQCFERRCLTWTPDNPPGWQVEAGNVGRHYYAWRYGADPLTP